MTCGKRDMTKQDVKELIGIGGLVLSFLVVVAVPYVVLVKVGSPWAVVAGIACPVVWLLTMPITCMNGGLIYSVFGIGQMFAGLTWAVIGIIELVKLIAR